MKLFVVISRRTLSHYYLALRFTFLIFSSTFLDSFRKIFSLFPQNNVTIIRSF